MLLAAALTLGLLPVVVMGRTIVVEETDSRFLLPVLPVAACLTAYLLLGVLRWHRAWMLVAGCGFLSGYCIVNDSLAGIAQRKQAAQWGAELEKYVPESPRGLTVAVFDPDGFGREPRAVDYELTARLIEHWPKAKQDHFWSTVRWQRGWPWDDTPEAGDMKEVFARLQNFYHDRLKTIHNGPVDQILWVHIKDDGSMEIRQQASTSLQTTVP